MREILFRGKHGKIWIYGSLVTYSENYHAISTFDEKNIEKKFCVNSQTVGQFTGLTDKNGVKIFEGDIIQWVKSDWKYLLKYELGAFCCYHIGLKNCDGNPLKWGLISRFSELEMEMEVIGTIHDNPELLQP